MVWRLENGDENGKLYRDWDGIKIKMADGIEMKIEMKMKMANCIEIGDRNENYKANGVGESKIKKQFG